MIFECPGSERNQEKWKREEKRKRRKRKKKLSEKCGKKVKKKKISNEIRMKNRVKVFHVKGFKQTQHKITGSKKIYMKKIQKKHNRLFFFLLGIFYTKEGNQKRKIFI